MFPSVPREALFFLDYTFRVAQVVLVIYVVITCPLDHDLTSNVCRGLFLYRRTIISPMAWICWNLAIAMANMLIRISHRSLLWLYRGLWDAREEVSNRSGYNLKMN